MLIFEVTTWLVVISILSPPTLQVGCRVQRAEAKSCNKICAVRAVYLDSPKLVLGCSSCSQLPGLCLMKLQEVEATILPDSVQ